MKSNNSNEIVINTIDTNSTNKKIEVYLYSSHNREEYKTNINPDSADRPGYSSLDNMMLRNTIGDDMRNWEDAIKTFVEEVK